MINVSVQRVVALFVFLMLMLMFQAPFASATEKDRNTVVTVGEMCGGCVKKITKHFASVKEIAEFKCDVEKKTVTFVPQKDVSLSPLKLWEEMEGIGKTPTKLVSPSGTFTAKPKKQ